MSVETGVPPVVVTQIDVVFEEEQRTEDTTVERERLLCVKTSRDLSREVDT